MTNTNESTPTAKGLERINCAACGAEGTRFEYRTRWRITGGHMVYRGKNDTKFLPERRIAEKVCPACLTKFGRHVR